MFEATVKTVARDGSYGYLENPMPGAKDIYLAAHDGKRVPREGERVLVLKEKNTQRGPKAVRWDPVEKK